MHIAILGGGINGLCVAWQLALDGHNVSLYEKNTLMAETSSASTKLLHGGLRYLEQGSFGLVKESLRERAWWLSHVPQIAHPVELLLPIYQSGRARALIKSGLLLYDLLAGSKGIEKHSWCDLALVTTENPKLNTTGLRGGYRFFDGQMDDYALGLWVADQAREEGVTIIERSAASKVTVDGVVHFENGNATKFDRIINVTGPWAGQLLTNSGISSQYHLDLVRGSHLILDGELSRGYFLEHPQDQRMFFALPYQGKILLGSTEVRQSINQVNECSAEERDYLLDGFNVFFSDKKSEQDIYSHFSGLRPLLRSARDPNKASREYEIERMNCLINVWGGKWTTARALAKKVAGHIQ
jgi:glycerol-3-phosphate dehydrogenase